MNFIRIYDPLITNDKFPVILVAQLVEHRNGIAEVRVQVPFRSEFSSGPSLPLLLKKRSKLRRVLILKLFPSPVQMKFHKFDHTKLRRFQNLSLEFTHKISALIFL